MHPRVVVDWYLNRALTNFRREVNSRWPNRDKTSDGAIGDQSHQQTNSDHNPDLDGSVDAWDMDVDGVPVWEVIAVALKHESIQYVIYNRQITSRSWGLGVWRPYTGANPHDKHVHFNTRPTHERSEKPWFEEDFMPLKDDPDFIALQKNVESIRHLVNVSGYRVEALVSNRSEYNDQQGNTKAVNRLSGSLQEVSRTLQDVSKRLSAVEARLGTPGGPAAVSGGEVASALLAHPGFLPAVVRALNDDTARRMRE